MKTKLLTALLAMSLSTPVLAVTVFGAPDCGQWIKEIPMYKEQYKGWLLGFVSGLNLNGRNKNDDPLEKISSAQQIFLWVDNYCKANPLKNLHQAGQLLIIELDQK